MRTWFLKFMGLVLWSMFLFAPFIAKADDGFDTVLPYHVGQIQPAQGNVLFSFGGINLEFDDTVKLPVEDKWSLKLNAGKDTVMFDDLSANIAHDRIPLDDGEREAMRFGVALNYSF